MNSKCAILVSVIVACIASRSASAQSLTSFIDDAPSAASRLNALTDSSRAAGVAVFWRSSGAVIAPGIRIAPLILRTELNSTYVNDRNNGAIWGGRGLNQSLAAGATFKAGKLSVAAVPEFIFQQNREFAIRETSPGENPFANPFYGKNIDLPQRFGADAYTHVAPGQSFIRADFSSVGIGVSTENLWWGPGVRQSIVLSNSAEGFPHAFFETNRPFSAGIALIGVSAFWGRLSGSDYFDTIPENNHRLFTGLGLTIQPKGLENLTLGITRLFAYDWDSLSIRHFIPFAEPLLKQQLETPENPNGNSSDDQRVTVFAHYRIPSAGFEVYGEFGREDHSYNLRDLVGEPEHSGAYLIGFQSLRPMSPDRSVRVYGEWLNLQNLRAGSRNRSEGSYYLHPPMGHTQRGQMLGAAIGPGAESQFLGVDVLNANGSTGGFIERVRRNEMAGPPEDSRGEAIFPALHDIELTAGARGVRKLGRIHASAQLSYSYRLQRDFIKDESNLRGVLQLGWNPSER